MTSDNEKPADSILPLDGMGSPSEEAVDAPAIRRPVRRIAASVAFGMGNTVVSSLLGALAIRVITVHVGTSNYGLFFTAFTLVTTATLLTDLGITGITGREIAKDPKSAASILSHNVGLRLSLSTALIPVLVALGFFLYGSKETALLWSIVLISLAVPFDALRSVSLGYFVSSIRNYYTAAIGLLAQVIYVGGVVAALSTHHGIVSCAASYLVATAVTGVLSFVITRREVSFRPKFDLREWKKVLIMSISLGVIQVTNLLYLKADTLLLSKMSTPHQVGLYGVAYAFITFLVIIPSLVMTSLFPLLATAGRDEASRLLSKSIEWLVCVFVIITVVVVVYAPDLVRFLSGSQYLGAAVPLRILTVSCLFTYLKSAMSFAAVARNMHRRIIAVSVVALVLNVALNVIAIPHFAIRGSATATLISEAVSLLWMRYVFGRDTDVRIRLGAIALRPVVVGVVIIAGVHWSLVRSWSSPVRSLEWLPVIVIACLGSFAVTRSLPSDISFAAVRARLSSIARSR